MKTLIPIAAALALAACNPANEGEREAIDPLPMDQDPTADQGRSGSPGMTGDEVRTPGQPVGQARTDNPPFDQSEAPEDVRLTAEIRRAVLDAENLSAGADNVQIVTRDGNVRLAGTVATEAEKQEIERLARGVLGAGTLTNEIEVEGGARDGAPADEATPGGAAPAGGTPTEPDPT